MITDIKKAIAKAINTEFNSDVEDAYRIYTEDISQDLIEPCFSIVHLLSTNESLLPPRYMRNYSFDIHYFPKDNVKVKEECEEVAERLFLCLELINFVDNTYGGIKMNYEVVEGVLHFFVSYNVIVKKVITPVESMETIETNVGLKDED